LVSEQDEVADGQDHSLDPRVIPLQQIGGGLFAAAVATVSLVAIVISLIAEDGPLSGWHALRLVVWLIAVLLLAWQVFTWPARAYRHTFYRVDAMGIEIRKGVFWRVVINIPRSRVQHIDVAQGPLERRYGLGKLVIYTAGTDHAKVELEGLEHGRALGIRQHLLPPKEGIEAGDAV
jgi:membrane protein YdbS with pleckstrin-like domain